MKKIIIVLLILFVIGLLIEDYLGVFIIQPIGAVPQGTSIVYWRDNMNMDLSFISSADGFLEKSGVGVSLLTRGVFLVKFTKLIKEREIFRFGYSETLYLYSTDGKKYENKRN